MHTYRLDFTEDMLATGSPSKTSIIDYYTIIENNGEYKLNINKFIGVANINKQITKDNILVNIQRKKIYMDYEIYDIKIENNTQNTILLDDMRSTDNIYVQDNNKNKYFWYNSEIMESDIEVRSGYSNQVSIKFNKGYNASSEIVKIVFANIVLEDKTIAINIEI